MFFSAASKSNELAIYIKDKDYEFSVDPEIIRKVGTLNFMGKIMSFLLNTSLLCMICLSYLVKMRSNNDIIF
jgi:hypothetical protein